MRVKDSLIVPARYCGPAESANGGYVAGLVTLSTLLGMLSLPFALRLLA